MERYFHIKSGLPILISQGIGDSKWSVYLRKPNGALSRCRQFQEYALLADAMQALRAYKGTIIRKETY